MTSTAAIILAAGASTRMGEPKQLLSYRGKTLLRSIGEKAIEANCNPVFVILGANFAQISRETSDLPVETLENRDWQSGMGSSIGLGIRATIDYANFKQTVIEAAVILPCDLPFLSAAVIRQLQQVYRDTNQPIVAATYSDTVGIPALFRADLFPKLVEIDRAKGAKQIIREYLALNRLATIDFPEGSIDLDTPEDYQQLRER